MENKVVEVVDKLPEMGGGIMDHWIAIIVGIVVVCAVGWLVWKKMKKNG
jgi:membrane protein DedA with SNARE-associated domain